MVTLDELIKQGECFASQIQYVPAPRGIIRTFSVYDINNRSDYENWKATTLRFIRVNYQNDKSISEFESFASKEINPTYHAKMIALIKALNEIPQINIQPTKQSHKDNDRVTINVNQSQNQNQEQSIIFTVFIESIKDELTGKQMKEIQEIIDNYKDKPAEAKTKIIDKVKSFGVNIMSNIIANIITNPSIFSSF